MSVFTFSSAEKVTKRHRDTCGCVPDSATLFDVGENKHSFPHCRDVCPYIIMRANTVRPYESENTFCLCTNKPNLKAPLSKGSWRRQATEGL